MPKDIRFPASVGSAALLLALVFANPSCSSPRPPDELGTAVAMGERPVAMRGEGVFFGGKLKAMVTISRGIGRGTGGDGKEARMLSTMGMDKDETASYLHAKIAVGSPLPPVTLHLKLQNLTKNTLLVEILDFESDLGNFATHPDILAMAAEQIAEPDPMISQMGVSSDEIPVKVSLRFEGAQETQIVLVKNLLASPGGDAGK